MNNKILKTKEDVQLYEHGLLSVIVHHVHASTLSGDPITLDEANFYLYSHQILEHHRDSIAD